jgi:hypothetical protein
MSLLGQGAVTIWNGIREEGRDEFFGWHNREHILERVEVPGFNRGRRYTAVPDTNGITTAPEFFTFYEVDDAHVLSEGPYLERLAAPTEWTRRAVPFFTDTARALTQVAFTSGLGQGGIMATLRFTLSARAEGLVEALPEIAARVLNRYYQVLGIHYCRTNVEASSVETAERRARQSGTDVPEEVLLIEGADPGAVAEVVMTEFSDTALGTMGASAINRGLYQHEITISRDDRSV